MIKYKVSCTNELATRVAMGEGDTYGNSNQLIIFALHEAISKYPDHCVTDVKYKLTHDKLKNLTHNWIIYMMPIAEFINQE